MPISSVEKFRFVDIERSTSHFQNPAPRLDQAAVLRAPIRDVDRLDIRIMHKAGVTAVDIGLKIG